MWKIMATAKITEKIVKPLDKILLHKNFSPETIRAYFTSNNVFDLTNLINVEYTTIEIAVVGPEIKWYDEPNSAAIIGVIIAV